MERFGVAARRGLDGHAAALRDVVARRGGKLEDEEQQGEGQAGNRDRQ